jgi:hypothetical protein
MIDSISFLMEDTISQPNITVRVQYKYEHISLNQRYLRPLSRRKTPLFLANEDYKLNSCIQGFSRNEVIVLELRRDMSN